MPQSFRLIVHELGRRSSPLFKSLRFIFPENIHPQHEVEGLILSGDLAALKLFNWGELLGMDEWENFHAFLLNQAPAPVIQLIFDDSGSCDFQYNMARDFIDEAAAAEDPGAVDAVLFGVGEWYFEEWTVEGAFFPVPSFSPFFLTPSEGREFFQSLLDTAAKHNRPKTFESLLRRLRGVPQHFSREDDDSDEEENDEVPQDLLEELFRVAIESGATDVARYLLGMKEFTFRPAILEVTLLPNPSSQCCKRRIASAFTCPPSSRARRRPLRPFNSWSTSSSPSRWPRRIPPTVPSQRFPF